MLTVLIASIDTRVADMTVYTKEGIILCKMQKLELRKVPSAPRTVKVRYGLHLQPVVSCQPLPRCETGWTRDERDMFIAANVTLDHLAVNIIKESLAGDLVVGDEVSTIILKDQRSMPINLSYS